MEPSSSNALSPAATGDLFTAETVVAVGRGVKDREGFALMVRFAEAAGAQLAATRGAVDEGWLPRERELGLSGKRIAPRLYIGCGVAGANFHTVGMDRAGTVVAINIDRRARIFQLADYGVICDVLSCVRYVLERLPAGGPPTAEQLIELFAACPGAVKMKRKRPC